MRKRRLSPSVLRGLIAISGFALCIEGMVQLFLGINHVFLVRIDANWVLDYFGKNRENVRAQVRCSVRF